MFLANIRVTFKNAPHNVLSQMALMERDKERLYESLLAHKNIDEVVILQTCNRFEVYFSGKGEENGVAQARKTMLDHFGAPTARYLTEDIWVKTIDHLFRTVASIDSMIVGENQILSQTKEAFLYASRNNYCGRVLTVLFQKALSVGKRIRTETQISSGKVSVSSAAVDLANQMNPLAGKNVLIVGSGNMASMIAEYLESFEIGDLAVVGRSRERLEDFCERYKGRGLYMDTISDELADADVLFSATSCPHVLITRDMITGALKDRKSPLTIIDIAMPEDVDPTVSELDGIDFRCLDDLEEISEANRRARENEASKAELIIEEELGQFMGNLQNFHIHNLLSHLNLYTEEIRQRELNRAFSMMNNQDPHTRKMMDQLTKALIKKVMHNFILALKDYPGDAEEIKNFVDTFIGKDSLVEEEEGDGITLHGRKNGAGREELDDVSKGEDEKAEE